MSRRPYAILRRGLWLAALAGLASTGLAVAQPTPAPTPPGLKPAPAAPPAPATPAAPAAEEAPPISVPTPEPLIAPPISEKEVAPAVAPKAQVEEKVLTAPIRRARFDVAVIQTIDKVTAESVRFEAAVGKPVRYKSLVFTVKACERSAPDEAIDDSIVYLTIDSQPRPLPGKPTPPARQAFKGWMYASSPGLNPMEHPVYDAWLISCRAAAPASAPAR
jgi:hypothetical protein